MTNIKYFHKLHYVHVILKILPSRKINPLLWHLILFDAITIRNSAEWVNSQGLSAVSRITPHELLHNTVANFKQAFCKIDLLKN